MSKALCTSFKNGNWAWELYDELESTEKIWREFEQEFACHVFHTFDWLSRWVEIVGRPVHSIRPCIVVVRQRGEIQFILPLGIRRVRGLKFLEWIGGAHADYQGPLVRKSPGTAPLTQIWEFVEKTLPKFDTILFEKQPEKIIGSGPPFVYPGAIQYSMAYSVLMEGRSWEQYQIERVSPKLRANSRRKRERLGELGDLKFVVASDHQTAKRLIQIMFVQKRRRYRDKGHLDMLALKEHRHFYEKMTDDLLENKVIHVSALEINNMVIATHWGALYRNRFYCLMPSFEGGKWERYSPGRLLIEHLLEWCFNNGVEEFDFTGGAERHKLNWFNHNMPLYYYMGGRNLKGMIYVKWRRTRSFVGKSAIGPLVRHAYNGLLRKFYT